MVGEGHQGRCILKIIDLSSGILLATKLMPGAILLYSLFLIISQNSSNSSTGRSGGRIALFAMDWLYCYQINDK